MTNFTGATLTITALVPFQICAPAVTSLGNSGALVCRRFSASTPGPNTSARILGALSVMDNVDKFWCDDYINAMMDIGFSTGNGEEMNLASSSEAFPFQPFGLTGDQSTEQLLSVGQEMFMPAIMPSSSEKLTLELQQDIMRKLPDMDVFASDRFHSLDESRKDSKKGGFRFNFNNTEETGDLHSNIATPFNTSLSRVCPAPDPDLVNDFLQAGAVGNFCAGFCAPNVVCNPVTEEARFLPPLNYPKNPVVVYKLDDKVVVAGSASEGFSLKNVVVYNPATGEWEFCTDSSFSLMINDSCHNGAYYKDSENREFFCCIDILDAKGTKGVGMYDRKKNQWVQGSIKRPIPLVRSELNLVSCFVTTHILECGGSIFVYSEQEIGKDIFVCIHRFNPDSFGDNMWEAIHMRLKTIGGPDLRGLQVYPEFTSVRPLNATMVECGSSAFVFSEQDSGEAVFICIQKRKCDGSGDVLWEEVMRRKKKRHRAPNWKADEITVFLKSKVEALEAVKGKPDWDFISESLERAGFNRGPQACEDLWGTQLRHLTDIQEYVQLNSIPGTSSSWASIWNMSENERSVRKLPRIFTLEWYLMMERIHKKKPRKKIGVKKKQILADGNASTSLLNDSTVTSENSSGLAAVNFPASLLALPTSTAPSTGISFDNFDVGDEDQNEDVEKRGRIDLISEVSGLCDFLLKGHQNLTNNQIAKKKDDALKIVKSNLQLEILKERNKARDCAHRRRRKSRKTNV